MLSLAEIPVSDQSTQVPTPCIPPPTPFYPPHPFFHTHGHTYTHIIYLWTACSVGWAEFRNIIGRAYFRIGTRLCLRFMPNKNSLKKIHTKNISYVLIFFYLSEILRSCKRTSIHSFGRDIKKIRHLGYPQS